MKLKAVDYFAKKSPSRIFDSATPLIEISGIFRVQFKDTMVLNESARLLVIIVNLNFLQPGQSQTKYFLIIVRNHSDKLSDCHE